MRILNVMLENYGPYYGRHDFLVADRGLVLVQGENRDEPRMNSNGSAKSSLFESIDWALFGVIPKNDHVDSIVHDEASGCGVAVVVEDDFGAVATIDRRRPVSLTFSIDGQDRSAVDTKETQVLINQWLGLDREVFHAAVFFGQEDLRHFADSSDAQRMEILSAIIPELGEVDTLLERAKDRRKHQQGIVQTAQMIVSQLSGQLSALEAVDYAQQIKDWDTAQEGRIRALEGQVLGKQGEWDQAMVGAAPLVGLQQAVAELEAQPAIVAPTTIEGAAEAHESLVQSRERYAAVQAEKRQFEGQLAQIQQAGVGRCPACGSLVSQEHLAFETQRLSGEILTKTQILSQIGETGMALQARENFLLAQLTQGKMKAEAQRKAQMEHLNHARIEVMRAQGDQVHADKLRQEITSLRRVIEHETEVVNPFTTKQQEDQAKVLKLRGDWRTARSVEQQAETHLSNLEFWVDAFGPRGIKSLILDTKLQELTDAANEWVRLLTGGTMWIRFESQKMGRTTKTLRNAPNIRVFRYHPDGRVIERAYKGWSGGEKQRVSWAVDFGLSRLVARRATKKWDLLILDEVFKHVDARGGEAIVEMLAQLQREKSSIFVIEHDSEFQSHFETVITARKERGRSRIVEVEDGDQRQEALQPKDGIAGGGSKPEARKKRAPRHRRVQANPSI